MNKLQNSKCKLIEERIQYFREHLKKCSICPRNCNVNRIGKQVGYCKSSSEITIYSAFLHQGEEPTISGSRGSGTIFFSGCNLRCTFCQNYKFSHKMQGTRIDKKELSQIMLTLQKKGAHNINLVTPTHFLPQILESLYMAFSRGLNIPIVYNTSGYEKPEIIHLLDGVVDIYLFDLKYFYSLTAKKYSQAPDYSHFSFPSLKEAYRQQKTNILSKGLHAKGLIVRHLVLPGHISETKRILSWLDKNIPKTYISLMFQYRPYFKAKADKLINRTVNREEYQNIINFLKNFDFLGWTQDLVADEKLSGKNIKPLVLTRFFG